MHWGSAAVNAPEHLMAEFSTVAQARQAAHQQGRSDLLQWLKLRAKDLKPGGQLVVTAIEPQNEASAGPLQQGYALANSSWSQLASQGHTTQQEFSRTCFPVYVWRLDACIEVINQELGDSFEIPDGLSGTASQTSSIAGVLSDEETSAAAAAGLLTVLGLGLRQALEGRNAADQDNFLHRFRKELGDQCLASHFEFFTSYIVLALKRR